MDPGQGLGAAPEGQPVRVCVRVRPLNAHEVSLGANQAVTPLGDEVVQTVTPAEGGRKIDMHQHQYDWVHPMHSSQEDVFVNSGVPDLCNQAMAGFTATVMAYGQTGSGKTHTMVGPQGGVGQLSGIIPRAADYIFSELERSEARVTVQACFLEIYNENVYDLLAPAPTPLPVRWSSANSNFYAESAMVVNCDNLDDLRAVIEEGVTNRSTASHLLNSDSSRSHSVLTVTFERESLNRESVTLGKINFVDLAGSERLKATQSAGQAIAETAHINKSLLALGQVVNVLSSVRDGASRKDDRYVPYRDSKLTMILMDSLGGCCKTTMIACVTPASCFVEETINTLKYASRTRAITNNPSIRMRTKGQTLDDMRQVIESLRAENNYLRGQKVSGGGEGESNGLPPRSGSGGAGVACVEDTPPAHAAHDQTIARLQLENERLRLENVALKKAQYVPPPAAPVANGVDPAPPPVPRPGHGELVLKKPQRRSLPSLDDSAVGRNGSGEPPPSTRSAPDAPPTDDGPVGARRPSLPGFAPAEPAFGDGGASPKNAPQLSAATTGNPQSQAELVRLLKSTLARVSLEAEGLRRGEGGGGTEGIAAVVRENMRLVDVLHGFDILARPPGTGSSGATPPRRHYSNAAVNPAPATPPPTAHDLQQTLDAAQGKIANLEAKVRSMAAELKAVTTDPEPTAKQYLLERRELRLQRDTNAQLRVAVRRLESQLQAQTREAAPEE
eukprot:TRINITY_DN3445_c0_g1_i1.p1 TRINITY_DN3445_c0_g1~~TRINITY_DN3445_c0_g1_i1.p1  ORF type:complete len:730 (+),score=201.04 TRINITY_DN3445_c0_g1_i1:136-2325(+)